MSLDVWNECVVLNTERKMNDGSERRNEKCDDIKLKAYNSSERQTKSNSHEFQARTTTLNIKPNW